ncbi:transcriptional regulator [Paenibacillus sp. GCM10027626]|uniref:transcriptional regulator n=1 Tax=Paenibacillus sp. GCM10027626 TaxID=3273411 RepID=UPI00362B87BD
MSLFDEICEDWLQKQMNEEKNPRRRELLRKGLGHGTIEFLRSIWFPAIGNLDHLYPEYEVRDFSNGYRYLDLAYMPGSAKGCIEIHGYRSHARDVEVSRFKDLCMKQALLVLDDWYFLPVAYLSIRDNPEVCKQLVLSFVGKFLSIEVSSQLNWAEAETLRFARRLFRPFAPKELAAHLRLSERQTRVILHELVDKNWISIASGIQRYRTYCLAREL